jgi:dTDP-4-amino-4,6-dideoxygalactose transaminase
MPMYREMVNREYPVSNALSVTGMNLPTYNGLTAPEVDEICTVIKNGTKK